ncbi:MAG TPA: peptide chain release factor N(5)-glutamine methyltransferase [Thermoanaerobaculia bacterium]|nr:peptide chain release factor N(5)-glutamine methyltransferase [Thermoanaerobaculia bacterium]
MTVKEVLEAAIDLASRSAAEATAWDARLLLTHAVGGRNPLHLDFGRQVEPEAGARFHALWRQRLTGVPVQHLLGEWDFYGRTFFVDRRTLAPRPETEALLTAALREAPSARRVLDAGTGSGVLAISFLLERPDSRAIGLDASPEALALARKNALRHGLGGRLALLAADWAGCLGRVQFDLAISNPPYLSLSEAFSLPATVREHDPARALFAGEDALSQIRRLLDELPRVLTPGAPFLFEIGFGQEEAVETEIRSRPVWRFERIEPDLAGIPRVAIARRICDL